MSKIDRPEMAPTSLEINSTNTTVIDGHRRSKYTYDDAIVTVAQDGQKTVSPYQKVFEFDVDLSVPKTGLLLVGWGGNNGSTLTAAIEAHRQGITWKTRRGLQAPNYYGSLLLASTVRLGLDENRLPVYVPFTSLLPFVDPAKLVFGGWDISSADIAAATERAQVLEPDMIRQLYPSLQQMKPWKAAFDPSFVAANQSSRADNILGGSKKEQVAIIRKNISEFKQTHGLDQVIVLWTANTERYSEPLPNHDKSLDLAADSLLDVISQDHPEVAPSVLYAVASILEGCTFINGSPQNTLIPGVIGLALRHNVPVAGDDFKSGQTKIKSVLADFLVSAGIKPLAITSYNHLGNNDGLNLSAESQFKSKEISKKGVVDDVVASNSILYAKNESPDHVIVIKYVPSVGDSKRALDEYEAEIFCGGRQTISMHTTCEDSLLAVPLMIDLVLLADLLRRVKVKAENDTEFHSMHPVFSHLAFCLKAPVFPPNTPVVHALSQQRLSIENFFKALLSLPPNTHMNLEDKLWSQDNKLTGQNCTVF